jgi:hypothetical protein
VVVHKNKAGEILPVLKETQGFDKTAWSQLVQTATT